MRTCLLVRRVHLDGGFLGLESAGNVITLRAGLSVVLFLER